MSIEADKYTLESYGGKLTVSFELGGFILTSTKDDVSETIHLQARQAEFFTKICERLMLK